MFSLSHPRNVRVMYGGRAPCMKIPMPAAARPVLAASQRVQNRATSRGASAVQSVPQRVPAAPSP